MSIQYSSKREKANIGVRQVQINAQLRKGSKKQTSWDVKMFAKIKLLVLFAGSVTPAQYQKHHFNFSFLFRKLGTGLERIQNKL